MTLNEMKRTSRHNEIMMRRPAQILYATLLLSVCLSTSGLLAADDASPWYERKTSWREFDQFHFKVGDRPAYLVTPKKAATGNPWVWRARFPGYHAEMDVTLLDRGFHVAYVDVAGMFGSPKAVEIGDRFYRLMTTERGLAKKPALEGVSRGGLFVYNWAAKNPTRVACIYCDTPVCDFKSWPGGRGSGLGSTAAWAQCLKAYGFGEEQALQYKKNPVDNLEVIVKAKIPILHVVSENDRVVPPKENSYVLKSRLETAGHSMQIISVPEGSKKSNGHHFTHPQPQSVVDFIVEHASSAKSSRLGLLNNSKRIVFLGDSITYAGHYVAYFDAWLSTQELGRPVIINVGLPSETVSGLSEEGHAGGRFPRPDLHERLDRVLAVTKPDLVFACYGINCGIYQPLDDSRLQSYQDGVRKLKQKVESAGAQFVFVTPPFYDDQRAKKSFSYNAVLDRYAAWLVAQQQEGWSVIDLHSAMNAEVAERRKSDAKFTFQPDAVHPNEAGHWFMASRLISWFGDERSAAAKSAEAMLAESGAKSGTLGLAKRIMALRRNAHLSAAGHKRPGIRAGLPLDEAEQKTQELIGQLRP